MHRLLLILACLLWAGTVPADTLRVVVISDLNGSYGSTKYHPRVDRAVARIIALRPDLVISTGDMVAGQRLPLLRGTEVDNMWRAFHERVSNPLAQAGIPLAVTPGNHDASGYRQFKQEREIYANEWRGRKPDVTFLDESDYPFFYAFRLGDVVFVSLDATTVGPLQDGQTARLKQLTAGKDTVIAFSHLPLWPFAVERETEVIGDPALQQVFREVGLDLHLSGHHHAFFPGWKDGVAFVGQACLGGGPRQLIGGAQKSGHAITLLEISEQDGIRITALEGQDFSSMLDWNDLPARITFNGTTLTRLDLADTNPARLANGPIYRINGSPEGAR